MPPSLTEKSYRFLRGKLTEGELPAGTQLVNRTLAKEIGVSMGPVREAINRLSQEGLVVHVPGAGAFVRQFSERDVENLFVVWEGVERIAAAESASNAGPREIEQLEEVVASWRDLVEQIGQQPEAKATRQQTDAWEKMAGRFLKALVDSTHNELLERIVLDHRLIARVLLSSRGVRSVITLRRAAWTWKDYAMLVRAIKRHDATAAKQLSDRRIQKSRNLVLGHIRKDREEIAFAHQ